MRHNDKTILLLPLILIMAVLMNACRPKGLTEDVFSQADSLIDVTVKARQTERLLVIVDSLEEQKLISTQEACLWRGWANHRTKQYSAAEDYYRKALIVDRLSKDSRATAFKAAAYLADLLYIKHDYEGALRVAIPAIQQMEAKHEETAGGMSMLLSAVGRCQMKLGRMTEAGETFSKAYQYNLKAIEADSTGTYTKNAVVHTGNVAIRYLNARIFTEADPWLSRTEALLDLYANHPGAQLSFVEEYRARLNIYHAFTLETLGKHQKAAELYKAYAASDYAKTDDGRSDACEYLIAARRYDEAADYLQDLDNMMERWGYKLTLDNLQGYLLPKYHANCGAGREDSAMVVARQICNALDSAIAWQKKDDAAELATIYDIQQKEMKIAQQEAELSRQWMIAAFIAVGLITLFFIIYALYRRKTTRRLAEKNAQLKIANARAEESSKMKTNFIQQISHEIRTPLNILSGFTQVVTSSGMELDEDTRQDINRQITENTDRITGLVNKMLELADAGSNTVIERHDQVQAIEIAAMAVETSGISRMPHLNFDIQLKLQNELQELTTNRTAAIRILTLLLDNAGKFTRQPESLHKQEEQDKHASVWLTLSNNDHEVLFTVQDTGIGIPENEAEHVFEEFVQLDEYYNGTGIGLTVARSLARRLDGDVTIDTSYKEGARFVLSLPV